MMPPYQKIIYTGLFILISLFMTQCGKDPLFGDIVKGTLKGSVRDDDIDEKLSSVTVELHTGTQTNQESLIATTISGADGTFIMKNIDPGTYTTVLKKSNYYNYIRTVSFKAGDVYPGIFSMSAVYLIENFDDNEINTTLWDECLAPASYNPKATYAETGGKLQMGPHNGRYSPHGIGMFYLEDFTFCQVSVKVDGTSSVGMGCIALDIIKESSTGYVDHHIFGYQADSTSNCIFYATNGLTGGTNYSDVTVYNTQQTGYAPTMLLKIEKTNKTLYFSYSSDNGAVWHQVKTVPLYPGFSPPWAAFNINLKGAAGIGDWSEWAQPVNVKTRFDDFIIQGREFY